MDSVIRLNNQHCNDSSRHKLQVYQDDVTLCSHPVRPPSGDNTKLNHPDKEARRRRIFNKLSEIMDETKNIIKFPLSLNLLDQQCIEVGEQLLELFQYDIRIGEQMADVDEYEVDSIHFPKEKVHFRTEVKNQIKNGSNYTLGDKQFTIFFLNFILTTTFSF